MDADDVLDCDKYSDDELGVLIGNHGGVEGAMEQITADDILDPKTSRLWLKVAAAVDDLYDHLGDNVDRSHIEMNRMNYLYPE